MTLSSHQAELQKMIKGFRVSDLHTLLLHGGKSKAGKKTELQARALELLRSNGPNIASIERKVRELHKNRYAQSHGHAEPPELYPPDLYSHSYGDPSGYSNLPSHKAPLGSGVMPSNFMPPYNHQMRSSASMGVMPQYPVNPDVRFKDLPFYDVLNDLIKPTSLVPVRTEIVHEKELVFYLGPQDIRELDSNTDCQVQFRIGNLENNQDQEDELPFSICIKVNSKQVNLPNPIPTNKPGAEGKRPKRPVDVTSFIKRSASEPQVLWLSWASSNSNYKPLVAGVFLVRRQNSSVLIKRLKDIGVRNPDHTTAMIKEKLNLDQDSEIATMSLRASLICPLGKIKMALPCRALTCSHLQCFDASSYIQMNEKKPKWICPVCDKTALFKSLAIDGLFLDITRKVPTECTEVQFHDNASWTPVMPVKKAPEIKEIVPVKVEPPKPKKAVEVVSLDSDSDTEDSWPIQPPKKKPCKPTGIVNPIVALDNSDASILIDSPAAKSFDVLQPCSSKSILSTSNATEKSQNPTNYPFLFSSSKDFESTYSPESPTPINQTSTGSTFQEPADINNPSSAAGQCYDFDLYSLVQPTENLLDTFQFPDAPAEETIVSDDTPDIISID